MPNLPTVSVSVQAYLWHTERTIRHYLRAESRAEARERIARTHGAEIARRAVIKRLALRTQERTSARAA